MHTAHVSADSEQPSDPDFDTLALLDLWHAFAEARSQPEAAVDMAHLIAILCNCDCVFLYLDHSDFSDCSWPPGLQVSPAVRGDRPSTATGVCRITAPIGFAVEEPAGTAWIPGAAFALTLADGPRVSGEALLCWRQTPATLPTAERLLVIGQYVTRGLRHAGRRADAERRQRYLALGLAIIAMIGRARAEDEMLAEALGQIVVSLDCEAGAIYMVSDDPSRLTLVAAAGNAPPEWRSAGDSWPVVLPTATGWMPGEFSQALQASSLAHAAQSWLAALASAPDRVLGWIRLADTGRPDLAEVEAQVLRTLGLLLGMAVERLRTHQTLERELAGRNARWAALYQVSVALAQSSDDAGLLQEIVRSSVDLLQARGGALILRDAAGDDLVVTAVHSPHLSMSKMVGKRFRPGEGVSGQAILSRKPIILDSYAAWPGSLPELADRVPYAAVAAPLISEGRAIGALTVSDETPGRRFTEDDAQTLSLFAQQAALILEGARRRQQERELALNTERTRLARDLHDGLAQDLAALLLRADACQSLLGAGDEALRERLEAISVGLQQAIRDARATIYALRANETEACGLEDGLRAQVARFEAQTGVSVSFSVAGDGCQRPIHDAELALLRVAQEALANVRKHAQARRVTMLLAWRDDARVELTITDEGRGCDPELLACGADAEGKHFGLALLRQQVEVLGGEFAVVSVLGQGTTVRAALPARARQE